MGTNTGNSIMTSLVEYSAFSTSVAETKLERGKRGWRGWEQWLIV